MKSPSRIKYKPKDEDGFVLESQFFYSPKWDAHYRIRLYMEDPNNMGYKVLDKDNEAKRKKFGYTNKNVLKRFARYAIMSLGVPFEHEHGKRNRTFGLCQKGYTQKEHRQNEKK